MRETFNMNVVFMILTIVLFVLVLFLVWKILAGL